MAYNVNVGAIVECTFKAVLFNQTIMNVRHYRISAIGAVTDGATLLSSVNDALNTPGGLSERLAAAMSSFVNTRVNRLQWIYPTRYRAVEFESDPNDGSGPVDCETANVAASIEMAAEEADRHGVGRMQIAGIAHSWMSDGRPTPVYFGILGSLATALTSNLITVDGVTLVPIIFRRDAPNLSYIVRQAGPKNEIRGQKTRIVGRGI